MERSVKKCHLYHPHNLSNKNTAMDDLSDFMEMGGLAAPCDIADMALRFLFNLCVTFGLCRWLYYPGGKRRDYLFVFTIISIAIFLMVYLLGSLKIKVGFALGLFAIFGIIRYRTEQMPVREMTYLFVIISLSVINGLSENISVSQMIVGNALMVTAIWVGEKALRLDGTGSKLIAYDDMANIRPERRQDLIADLRQRTGLDVTDAEVGHIDFVRDMAIIRIHYNSVAPAGSDIENLTKIPNNL